MKEEKKLELKRHRDIILATIDYTLERIEDDLRRDESGGIIEYFQKQKKQTEKYYQNGRLDRLQQKLQTLTQLLRFRKDLSFATYIKEKTGYDIDIFENVRSRVDTIIQHNQIKNDKELGDVSIMLDIYEQRAADGDKSDILSNLVLEYAQRASKEKRSPRVKIEHISR